MSLIAASYIGSGGAALSGGLYRITDDFASIKRLFLPPASAAINRAPSGYNYGNRHYLVGGHTANLLVDEEYRALRQSIPAPNTIPSVSVGAGSTLQICYTRFYDEKTNERGPLSEGFSVTGNTTRTWSSLPTEVPNEVVILDGTSDLAGGNVTAVAAPTARTNYSDLRPGDRIANAAALTRWAQIRSIASATAMTIDDTGMAAANAVLVAKVVSRVSHVELWVSVSGALPRFAVRVRIGTTSVIESVASLALGEAEIISFTAMPFGQINLFYNDRQLISGVEGHRDSVYLSQIGFPERFEGLQFVTPYNEPIVGMFRYRDYVVLLCPDSSYKLQGYTEDDYVRTVLDADIGGLGHLCNGITEGRAIVPGRKGVQIFNGAFHQGIPTRRSEWTTDYVTNRLAFEQSFAVVNPNDSTFQFIPRFSSLVTQPIAKAMIYVGQYDTIESQAGGSISPLEWMNDSYNSPDGQAETFATYFVPSGQRVGKLLRGYADGKIYEEDEAGITAHIGEAVLVTFHDLMGDPGGNMDEGKELIRIWSYVVSEGLVTQPTWGAWKVRIWTGDEFAYAADGLPGGQSNIVLPQYVDDVAASISQQSGVDYTNRLGITTANCQITHQEKVVHTHPIVNIDGRGFTFEYRFTNPLNVFFLGLGGFWEPGKSSRPVKTVVPLG